MYVFYFDLHMHIAEMEFGVMKIIVMKIMQIYKPS